ncbi:hypothetical protein FJTKL_04443 [Diaporthe vaccinii]
MTGVYLYLGHILTVKLSVLALFYRIFGINRTYRIWIYIIGGFQTMLCIIFCVFQGLQCRPFERYFDKSIPGTCRDDGVVIVGGETPNSFVDFAMVALAMVMIRPRQLPRATKWRLRVLFGFGIIAGTLGFVKIAVTFSLSEIYAFSMVSLWTCVQMFVSLLCCCLPVFQPLLTGSTFWTRLSSRLSSFTPLGWVSRIRSTGASTNNSGKNADLTPSSQHRWSFNDLEQNPGKQADLATSTQQRWSFDDLEQPSSSSENLPWPQATYQGPEYSMRDLPIQGVSHPEMTGIHVQREFGLIRSEAYGNPC